MTEGDCKFGMPDLWVSNQFAWELYQKCSGQVIVAGMGDVLGIKFEAIEFLFNLYDIDDRDEKRLLFQKIQIIDILRLRSSRNKNATIGNQAKNRPRKK